MVRNAASQDIVTFLGTLEPRNWPECLQQLVNALDSPDLDRQEVSRPLLAFFVDASSVGGHGGPCDGAWSSMGSDSSSYVKCFETAFSWIFFIYSATSFFDTHVLTKIYRARLGCFQRPREGLRRLSSQIGYRNQWHPTPRLHDTQIPPTIRTSVRENAVTRRGLPLVLRPYRLPVPFRTHRHVHRLSLQARI